jgi:hypothetical protein
VKSLVSMLDDGKAVEISHHISHFACPSTVDRVLLCALEDPGFQPNWRY